MKKKIKILSIHKDYWSYKKFRKKIFYTIENELNLRITNVNLYNNNQNCNSTFLKGFESLRKIKFDKFNYIFVYGIRKNLIYQIYCKIKRFNNKNFYFFTGLGFLFTNRNKIFKFFFFKYLTFFFTKDDKIILQNSIDYKIFKKKLPNHKIYLIQGNGVLLKNALENKKIRDYKRIIFGSRLIKNKGIKELIQIIENVNKSNIKVKYKFYLYLIIDNKNIDKYKISKNLLNLKNTKITFNKRNIMNDIKNSDLSIFTSYREGLSQFLLECLSCNLPIITFDVPGCSDLVNDKYNGFLIKKGDVNEFVDKLILLITDHEIKKRFQNNSKKIVKDFSYDTIVNKYLKLLN